MKMKWIAGVVTVAAMAVPAFGQVGIFIGRTPPPLRYEVQPPMPGEGYTWVDGYWNWSGGRYNWMPGEWNRPPYEGAYWSHPHYDHYDRGWQMQSGHWDHEDHGHGNGNAYGRDNGNGNGHGNGRGNGHGNGNDHGNGNEHH